MLPRHILARKNNTSKASIGNLFNVAHHGTPDNHLPRRSSTVPYCTLEKYVWSLIPNDLPTRNEEMEKAIEQQRNALDKLLPVAVDQNTPQRHFEGLLKKAMKNSFGPVNKDKFSLSVCPSLIPDCRSQRFYLPT
jgi:hypothetical protein